VGLAHKVNEKPLKDVEGIQVAFERLIDFANHMGWPVSRQCFYPKSCDTGLVLYVFKKARGMHLII